ncbi:phosphotransferase [Metabacillus sp. SLBN-84]
MELELERCFDSFKAIHKIEKGFSYDKKYLAVDEDGKKYVIRTADLNQQASKLKEYDMLKEAEKRGIQSSVPVDFGIIEPLNICYMIVRYIEGEEALGVLPILTVREQYEIGFEAGLELRALHTIPAPPAPHTWYEAACASHMV